jgi:hypothetical protein
LRGPRLMARGVNRGRSSMSTAAPMPRFQVGPDTHRAAPGSAGNARPPCKPVLEPARLPFLPRSSSRISCPVEATALDGNEAGRTGKPKMNSGSMSAVIGRNHDPSTGDAEPVGSELLNASDLRRRCPRVESENCRRDPRSGAIHPEVDRPGLLIGARSWLTGSGISFVRQPTRRGA